MQVCEHKEVLYGRYSLVTIYGSGDCPGAGRDMDTQDAHTCTSFYQVSKIDLAE